MMPKKKLFIPIITVKNFYSKNLFQLHEKQYYYWFTQLMVSYQSAKKGKLIRLFGDFYFLLRII